MVYLYLDVALVLVCTICSINIMFALFAISFTISYPKSVLATLHFDTRSTSAKCQACPSKAILAQSFQVTPPASMETLTQPVIHGVLFWQKYITDVLVHQLSDTHVPSKWSWHVLHVTALCQQCAVQGASHCILFIPTLVSREAPTGGTE